MKVIYTTPYEPDLSDAREVLAFVLMPIGAFTVDPDECAAIANVLGPAKLHAVERWKELRAKR